MRRRSIFRCFERSVRLIGLIIFTILSCSCSAIRAYVDSGYTYQIPEQTGDGWQTASLQEVGMDSGRMVALMNDLEEHPDHWVHSVVVIKDGKLVFEAYFPGRDLDLSQMGNGLTYATRDFDRDTLHSLASDSKSITSILMGIAIDKALVSGTDETLFSYFPEYAYLSDPVKDQITLKHTLAMASGLPWTEAYPYDDPRNDLTSMILSEDPIGFVLAKSMVAAPGEQFIYNSGTANLLGEIIHRTSGMTVTDFAEQYLFAPLGIEAYEWYPFPTAPEMTVTSSTLYLRPRDMAKIGQMYLDGGVWDGMRVVSDGWVSKSTQNAVDIAASGSPMPSLNPGYGYLWWLGTFPTGDTQTYFAAGWGGQFIFVLPEPKIVVVITAGGFENGDYNALLRIVNNYVLLSAGL
jgi:CubicO group peptidase (beta-lactamase class C family)